MREGLPELHVSSVSEPAAALADLREAVAMHCARGGEKLRRQRLAASHLTAFISTSRFRQHPEEVYSGAASLRLPFPTGYTPGLISAAQPLLERVYKPGFVYRKAGVFLTDLVPEAERQQSVLEGIEDERRARAMYAVDDINRRHGSYTVRPLSLGAELGRDMRRRNLSPRYTTRIDEVLRVKARQAAPSSVKIGVEVGHMAKRRHATRVTLTESQRERLERLWFVYGNYGPKTTPGNHQFIQGLLEHGLDLRPLQTSRTPKRERPTEECVAAVEAALASAGGDAGAATRFGLLRPVPSPDAERRKQPPDPELKKMLDEMRRRLSAKRDRGGFGTGGKDAA